MRKKDVVDVFECAKMSVTLRIILHLHCTIQYIYISLCVCLLLYAWPACSLHFVYVKCYMNESVAEYVCVFMSV